MIVSSPDAEMQSRPDADLAAEGWDVSPRLRRRIQIDTPPAPRERAAPNRKLPTSRGVLTPAEIEALLRPDLSDMDMPPEPEPVPAAPAEFGGPGFGGAGPEAVARRIAARLSRAMREHCGLAAAVTVKRVSQAAVADAVTAREERGQAIVCFADGHGDVSAMLVLGAGIAQLMIETACGGAAVAAAPRPLSPIDLALLEGLARPLVPALGGGLVFSGVETDPLFAASVAAPGAGYEIALSVRAGGADWPARLLVPSALLEPPPEVAVQAMRATPPSSASGALTVLLTARVASVELPLSRLTSLRPGATLMLGVPAGQPVELLSGDRTGDLAAEAEIGRKGNRMALKITRCGPALRALNLAKAG